MRHTATIRAKLTLPEDQGVGKETPFLDLGYLGRAVGAVMGKRLLLRDVDAQGGIEGLNLDLIVSDVEKQLTRDEGAAAVLGIVV